MGKNLNRKNSNNTGTNPKYQQLELHENKEFLFINENNQQSTTDTPQSGRESVPAAFWIGAPI